MAVPTIDTSLLLILITNVLGYVAIFIRNRITNYQHQLMWAEFKRLKKLRENGNGNYIEEE